MATYTRIFVIENGSSAIVRDETGVEVTFRSLEELSRCTGIDFTSKHFMGYEPDNEFWEDSEDPSAEPAGIPHAAYENIIDSVLLLQGRVEDPYYGVHPMDKPALAVVLHKAQAEENQARVVEELMIDAFRVSLGLVSKYSPAEVATATAYVLTMQGEIAMPNADFTINVPEVPAFIED